MIYLLNVTFSFIFKIIIYYYYHLKFMTFQFTYEVTLETLISSFFKTYFDIIYNFQHFLIFNLNTHSLLNFMLN